MSMSMKKFNRLITPIVVLALVAGLAGQALAEPPARIRVLIGFDKPAHQQLLDMAERVRIVENAGGRAIHPYKRIPVVVATIPRKAAGALRKHPKVAFVEEDGKVWALDQDLPWGVDRIDAEMVHAYNKGAGVKVAIMDTGIDLDHPDLQVAGDVTFVAGTSSGDDDHGHGTHVAGIVAALDNDVGYIGVAPEVALFALKVLDRNGRGYWSAVAEAIEWAVDNDIQVINMSFGSSAGSLTLEAACDYAYEAGVVLVAAAGNSGNSWGWGDNVLYPAKYDSVIAVAATDSSDQRPSFSSTGPAVELAAPGLYITSTCRGNTYCTKSGTSMASPHVAGVAALVIASGIDDANSNGRTNDETRQTLQETADDLGAAGRDTHYGYGLVDAYEAAPPSSNQSPVADAGPDQTVADADGNGLESVTLDGSASHDLDGSIIAWEWSESGTPLGSGETLVADFSVSSHTVILTVTDNEDATDTDEVIITVNPNQAPVADAGPDQTVTDADGNGMESVTLDGSASYDPDGLITAWEWSESGTPLGSGEILVADFNMGSHTVTLTVTDDGNVTETDEVIITVNPNQAPVADAGPDQTVADADGNGMETVTLDASGSYDPDGSIIAWEWSESGTPLGSGETLVADFSVSSHTVTLTVTDNEDATATDDVIITVEEPILPPMHVASVDMALVQRYFGWVTYAKATVKVVDIDGVAVTGARVSGHWENATTDSDSGFTNSGGIVTFSSNLLRRPPSGTKFVFVVDTVTKDGWFYHEAGSITTGEITVP